MFFASNDYSSRAEVLLVTEYVGLEISRAANGALCIVTDGKTEALNPSVEGVIGEAAVRSLETFHDNGILHRDIALRNLRVQKADDDMDQMSWRVWWLDFGESRMIYDDYGTHIESLFKSERAECESLFRF